MANFPLHSVPGINVVDATPPFKISVQEGLEGSKCINMGHLMWINPAKRNVLDLKNETCKNREKRNVLKNSRTRHFKTTKKQSKTGCFYSF